MTKGRPRLREEEQREKVNFRLPKVLVRKLRVIAEKKKVTLTSVIEKILTRYISMKDERE